PRIGNRNIKGILHAERDTIALHAWQKETRSQDGDYGEKDRIPLDAQSFLDIKGRAATILAVLDLFVDLPKRSLGKSRRTAQKRNRPHPKNRARPARGDSRGHASDVAGTDTARKRD